MPPFSSFGDHLSHEDAWLTISVERSAFVATLGGGIAQMIGHVLQSIFCCQEGLCTVATSHWLDIFEACPNVEPAIAGKGHNQTSHTVLP